MNRGRIRNDDPHLAETFYLMLMGKLLSQKRLVEEAEEGALWADWCVVLVVPEGIWPESALRYNGIAPLL